MSLLFLFVILALRYGPQLFFEHMVYEVGTRRAPLPLTGHDVARRLLDQNGIGDITVVDEPAEAPAFDDHYDANERTVSLSPAVASARTAVAYAIAAHEVGHAIQHATGSEQFDLLMILKTAGRYVDWLLLPAVALALWDNDRFRTALTVALVAVFGARVLISAAAVPIEWDASFGRGLPALSRAGLLPAGEATTVRWTLFAAATTYIGAAIVAAITAVVLLAT